MAGVLWDSAASNGSGSLAVVGSVHANSLWPHASIGTIYCWNEGSDRFVEYKRLLVQKGQPSIGASAGKMVYVWVGTWYETVSPKF
jgi:hypothetical protein